MNFVFWVILELGVIECCLLGLAYLGGCVCCCVVVVVFVAVFSFLCSLLCCRFTCCYVFVAVLAFFHPHDNTPVHQVFVANPDKPACINEILLRRREKLLEFLSRFHPDRSEDEQFNDEKAYLIKHIKELKASETKRPPDVSPEAESFPDAPPPKDATPSPLPSSSPSKPPPPPAPPQ